MTDSPNDSVTPTDPVRTATDRLTREVVTPGADPREVDDERSDLDAVAAEQNHRARRHADQLSAPEAQMGTSSTTEIDAGDPLERDA